MAIHMSHHSAARRDRATLTLVATYLIIAAAAWYLLTAWANILRPLLLAALLAYTILPLQGMLARKLSGTVAYFVLAAGSLAFMLALILASYQSALELNAELPRYIARYETLRGQLHDWIESYPWLAPLVHSEPAAPDAATQRLRASVSWLAGFTSEMLTEASVVAIYLLFLLLEVTRYPARVSRGLIPERARQVLTMIQNINQAIAGFLKVKVLASLLLALPVAVVLFLFGVKFAVLWGVLTFFLNFIPYVGSMIALSLPILQTFLQLDFGWQPITVAGLLLFIHGLTGYLVEPAMTGKAVGLSPVVILLALAFWSQCWGVVGMLLAVPLTVVLKIVLANIPATAPLAVFMGDDTPAAPPPPPPNAPSRPPDLPGFSA